MRQKKQIFSSFISQYRAELMRCLDSLDISALEKAAELIWTAYTKKHHVYIIGNGGSASTASHMACDLSKGTVLQSSDEHEGKLRVSCLSDNTALISALANDMSYDDVFVQQLYGVLTSDDILIALSVSGNSENIIRAITYAKQVGAKTIGFLGFQGRGTVSSLVDVSIVAHSDQYGPCEDMHLILDHIISSWLFYLKNTDPKKQKHPNKKKNNTVPYSIS